MKDSKNNKDILLPPGYKPINPEEIKNRPEVRDKVRRLHDKFYYLFDPQHAGYLEYLETCKKDTKDLAKALQRELDQRGVDVWVKGKSTPAHRRSSAKINILVRPPFLQSFVSKWEKSQSRMQKDDRRDNFVLHIDPQHHLQMVRNWGAETESYHGMQINNRRTKLGATLELYLQDMENMYGQWDIIAKKIADAIQKPLSYEELDALVNPSPESSTPGE